MPRKSENRHAFNVVLSTDERNMLHALTQANGTSAGAEIRAALRARHAMIVSMAPTCGNGHPCFVPQMHRPAAPVAGPMVPVVNSNAQP